MTLPLDLFTYVSSPSLLVSSFPPCFLHRKPSPSIPHPPSQPASAAEWSAWYSNRSIECRRNRTHCLERWLLWSVCVHATPSVLWCLHSSLIGPTSTDQTDSVPGTKRLWSLRTPEGDERPTVGRPITGLGYCAAGRTGTWPTLLIRPREKETQRRRQR